MFVWLHIVLGMLKSRDIETCFMLSLRISASLKTGSSQTL